MRPKHIVIAGAGIGGLAAARALALRGFEVTVLERAAALSEVGAGITLWRNALNVLEALGLDVEIRRIGHEPLAGGIGLSDGRPLLDVDLDCLPRRVRRPLLLTFHRRDLQRVLYEAVPAGVVQFGRAVAGYSLANGGVRVHLDRGPDVEGDLLIGADGVASLVRRQMLGDGRPRYAGYTCWRAVTGVPGDRPLHVGELWGLGDRFGCIPIAADRAYWFAVADAPAHADLGDAKQHLIDRFARYARGILELIEATPSEHILRNDIVDRPPTPTWSDERVVLLGDAAHPTTPNLGQGAAMALESAIVLARALAATDDAKRAVAQYVRVRFPRARLVTERSWRVGRIAHLRSGPARWGRDLLMRALPKSIPLRGVTELLDYDASRVALV
jgi:2-polyprenyl-6-methoxyphenol hydroxylase-like FAD-dependent oxidoreductase